MTEPVKALRAEPYSYAEARAVADALGVSEPVAITLVRRGYRTPKEAEAFLDAAVEHDPAGFDSIGEVTRRVLGAIAAGKRITVHGDFDVDGVCATALTISTLRELGADCDWLIPDRLAEGYGLAEDGIRRLAERGTGLLLTVDCGITAVEQVALAGSLGMDVVVTDHHQPGESLPDCPVLHPGISGYPFPDLCGTGVAWKLGEALRVAAGVAGAETDLDLVALATVADLVPLVGENRTLVRRGLAQIRRGSRLGLRALTAAAGCEIERLDEGDLAFRLAPRINAAGRLYRADAGVELMLTGDEARARRIAEELDAANHERRDTEREVRNGAEAALRELPSDLREAPGLVLGGRGWHPGVVGIVASRLVEDHWRPVVLVSLDEAGGGRGSGRSIPGFDLLAGLDACSEHLAGFGGHRAAAGLELRPGRLAEFQHAFAEHATSVLSPAELTRTDRVDAMVGGPAVGLPLAEELERLAPFGMGNPGVRLLVPSARVRDVRPMGEGKHSRFSLHSGAYRSQAIAFGRSSIPVGEEDAVDAAVRLEVNHWNGSVEPRLVLRDLYPAEAGPNGGGEEDPKGHSCECEAEEWWQRLEREADADPGGWPPAGVAEGAGARERVRRTGSPAAVLAELVSCGEPVLAICADAARRAELVTGASGLARFAAGQGTVLCGRCPASAGDAQGEPPGLVLADYDALALHPDLPGGFRHVVLVDPPPFRHGEIGAAVPCGGGGYLHPVWGPAEHAFAVSVVTHSLSLRGQLA
ncbi:MAG TPA: single-stranded-DNA-specific exonuclease RecJ, partial [Solirubrobacterales bacterium]|nr:single-stranded-DNA-specific exonuclease RecJ [Solirubrobacterales bacterium]